MLPWSTELFPFIVSDVKTRHALLQSMLFRSKILSSLLTRPLLRKMILCHHQLAFVAFKSYSQGRPLTVLGIVLSDFLCAPGLTPPRG